jgi:hypothetical protein
MRSMNIAARFSAAVLDGTKHQTFRDGPVRHPQGACVSILSSGCMLIAETILWQVMPTTIHLSDLIDAQIAGIEIGGQILDRDEIEAFALLDGFAPVAGGTARAAMGHYFGSAYPGHRALVGHVYRWIPPGGMDRVCEVLIAALGQARGEVAA